MTNVGAQMDEENQHWVPKFLIKNFADKDGRVYRLNILTDEVTKPPPKFAASDFAFNEFEVEGKQVTFEDRLEKIETAAAPHLRTIVATRSLAGVSLTGKRKIADFIAAQSFRTEAFYKGMGTGVSRREFGDTFTSLWRSAFIVADEVAQRDWALMVIEPDDCFYLGDNPVVLQRTANPKDGIGLGFDVAGVEAFMPLSPMCALYMPCRSTSGDIRARYAAAMDLHRVVRAAVMSGARGGGQELQTAQLVISRLHPLFEAFTTGKPITASEENIQNLNYLQCSWSHSAIYSNRRDFAFGRHMLKESPQYKGVPRSG